MISYCNLISIVSKLWQLEVMELIKNTCAGVVVVFQTVRHTVNVCTTQHNHHYGSMGQTNTGNGVNIERVGQ